MNQAKEIDHISIYCVIQIERKRLGAPTRKAVRANVIATLPRDNLASVAGNPLAKGVCEAIRDLSVFCFLLDQV